MQGHSLGSAFRKWRFVLPHLKGIDEPDSGRSIRMHPSVKSVSCSGERVVIESCLLLFLPLFTQVPERIRKKHGWSGMWMVGSCGGGRLGVCRPRVVYGGAERGKRKPETGRRTLRIRPTSQPPKPPSASFRWRGSLGFHPRPKPLDRSWSLS